MRFDLVRPCDSCPFRTDRAFFLHGHRAREIARALVKDGQTFQCHKTLEYEDEEDDAGHAVVKITTNSQHCAGAAIMLEHMKRPNQWMQISSRMGWRDASKLDMNAPVFRTAAEFVKAHQARE
jgi:hypothetical protein